METYRRRVGYGSGGVERDSNDLLTETRQFLETMEQVIEDAE